MVKRPDDDPHIWDGDTCMICCLDAVDVQTGMDQGVCTPRTRVVNMAKHRYDVYVGRGRGSVWGNPFHEDQRTTKSEVIERYRAWIQTQPHLMARLPELRGKVLGCWCKPDICHGDVLAELADLTAIPPKPIQPRPCAECADPTCARDTTLLLTDQTTHEEYRATACEAAAMQAKVKAGLAAAVVATKRRYVVPDPPPQYDEIFAAGVAALDADAGEVYTAPAAAECQPAVLPPTPVNLDDYDTTVIILDVETTGVDTHTDQVIELAVQFGFGEDDHPGPCEVMRFKPTIPIPAEATAIHGIRDEDVAALSSFGAAAAYVERIIEAATVIVGYNVEFDLKMLDAELRRVKRRLDLRGKLIVDPMQLWRVCEPRTLQGAHARFVGSTFENAHSAGADVAATGRVLLGMLEHFGHAGKFWDEIALVAAPDRPTWLGFTNHFVWKAGRVVLNFGKHAGVDVRAGAVKGYLTWMQKQDFPVHVLEIARAAANAKTDAEFLRFAAQAYPAPMTPAETLAPEVAS